MVEPQHKRVKLPGGGGKLLGVSDELPSSELQLLHHQLCSKCLCSLQLHQILNTFNRCNLYFSTSAHYQIAQGIEGSLVYASLLTLFFEVALKQQSRGLVCTRISEVVMSGADNESDIISILFEFLAQDNRYVSYSAMRALVSLLLLLRGPLAELLICRFIDIMLHSNNWLQLGHSFEAVRRVIEWKDVDEHPLEAGEDSGPPPQCKLIKLSLTDIYGSNGVKYRATKILDYNWDALVSRSLVLLEIHSPQREHVFVSFVSLWTALISVKNNLHFGNIKEFYRGLENLINPLLNRSTALVVWEKILDLFNEVLCYGSTLALQEVVAEEPCQLAARLISAVRSRHLLEFVPCGQLAEDVSQTHTDQNRTSQLQGDFRQTQVRTRLQTQEQLGHYSGLQLDQPSNSHAPTSDLQSDPWTFHDLQFEAQASCHDAQSDNSLTAAVSCSDPQSSNHLHSLTGHHRLKSKDSPCSSNADSTNHSVMYPGFDLKDSASQTTVNPIQPSLARADHQADQRRTGNCNTKTLNIKNDLNIAPVSEASKGFDASISYLEHEKSEGSRCSAGQEVLQQQPVHKNLRLSSDSSTDFHSNLISENSKSKFGNCDEHLEARTNSLADKVKKQISNLYIDNRSKHVAKDPAKNPAVSTQFVQHSTSQVSQLSSNISLDEGRKSPKNLLNQSQVIKSTTEIPSHPPLVSSSLLDPSAHNNIRGCQPRFLLPEEISLQDATGSSISCSSHGLSDAASVTPSRLEQSINGLQILQNCYGLQEDDSDNDEAVTDAVPGGSREWQPWVVHPSDKYVAGQCSNSIRTSFNNLSVNNMHCSDKLANVNTNSTSVDIPTNQNSDGALRNRTFYFTSANLSDASCASTSKEITPVNNNPKLIKSSEQPIMFDGRGGLISKSHSSTKAKLEPKSSCSQYMPTSNTLAENQSPGDLSRTNRTMYPQTPGTSLMSSSNESNREASGTAPTLRNHFTGEDSEMSSCSEGETEESSSIVKDSEQHLRVVVFRKAVLMVLKAIAVTVKEARGDGGSSSSSSENSSPRSRGGDSETEEMDMEIIGMSLKGVLAKVDEFVKRHEFYHPNCLVAEWLVKLFSAQDDWMVEAMVCGLDIYSGLGHSVSGVSAEVAAWLCPHTSFLVFIDTVRYDYSVLLDLLVSNETCFLLYLLRYLKVTKRSWSSLQSVAPVDGANMHLAMETMQQLHDSITGLVAKELFPYDITPVLRLLDHCHQLFTASH